PVLAGVTAGGLDETFEAASQIRSAAQSSAWGENRAKRADVASFSTVIPREGGESSIPRHRARCGVLGARSSRGTTASQHRDLILGPIPMQIIAVRIEPLLGALH